MIGMLVLVFIAVAGVLVYALATTNPKVAELGRLIFFCAFFFLMYALAVHGTHVFELAR
jgi:hypothetical protein